MALPDRLREGNVEGGFPLPQETIRGTVKNIWEREGRPHWGREQTIRVCETVDEDFSNQGLMPAPRLREARDRNDVHYVQTWVLGCHFSWLNPRGR